MKRFLLAGVGLAVLSVAASAADLPSRSRQPVVPVAVAPAFTWTGVYAGVNAGYGFSAGDNWRVIGNPAALAFAGAGNLPLSGSTKRSGFVGGGQLGANYQYGQFVIGAETDIQSLNSTKRTNFTLGSGTYGSYKDSSTWLGTSRVRLGFTPVDRLLVYGTGGAAYGSVRQNGWAVAPSLTNASWGGAKSDTKFGWTVGAGAEYAFTNNITGKLEYLYYDLGRSNMTMAALNASATATGAAPVVRSENRGSIIRAGLNYKF